MTEITPSDVSALTSREIHLILLYAGQGGGLETYPNEYRLAKLIVKFLTGTTISRIADAYDHGAGPAEAGSIVVDLEYSGYIDTGIASISLLKEGSRLLYQKRNIQIIE